MTGATGNIYFGLSEWIEMAFLLHVLRPGELFVDVGANIGSFTLLAAGGVGAMAKSAEPVPSTFEKLRRNIAANGLETQCELACIGLSDQDGSLWFTADQDTTNQIVWDATNYSGKSQECPVTTLDTWLINDRPVLLKVDVEGHDRAVFAGARRLLDRSDLLAVIAEIWLEEPDGPDGALSTANILRVHGFFPVQYEPQARRLTPIKDAQTGGNVIFVRDLDVINARINEAPLRELSLGRMI